jgi:hypothetical protein
MSKNKSTCHFLSWKKWKWMIVSAKWSSWSTSPRTSSVKKLSSRSSSLACSMLLSPMKWEDLSTPSALMSLNKKKIYKNCPRRLKPLRNNWLLSKNQYRRKKRKVLEIARKKPRQWVRGSSPLLPTNQTLRLAQNYLDSTFKTCLILLK